jgi:hypothetical protein
MRAQLAHRIISRKHTVGCKRVLADVLCCSLLRYPKLETADCTDCTDFEEVVEDDRTNLFVAKVQGVANRNLLSLYNLRNLWLNLSRFLG